VRLEFAKTAELKLCSGIWLHVTADRETYSGTERVWADPSWHGTVSAGAGGAAKRFLMEVDGRGACV